MTVGEWLDREKAAAIAEGHAAGLEEGLAKGLTEGKKTGRINSLLDILTDLGSIPESFHTRLQDLDDDTLKRWIPLHK